MTRAARIIRDYAEAGSLSECFAPWGFDVSDITTPVQLWHGADDQFVPFQHGEWLAARIPGVDAHLSDTDGHLTLAVNRVPEVHEWLLQHH